MSDRLPPDFDCLYDIKTMEDVERIAAGDPHHSNATVDDLIECFITCKLEVPQCLWSADSKSSTCCTCGHRWKTGHDGSHSCTTYLLEEVRRFTLLNEASIEQMNENQKTIDQLTATLAVCNNKVILDISLGEIIRLRAKVKELQLLVGYT